MVGLGPWPWGEPSSSMGGRAILQALAALDRIIWETGEMLMQQNWSLRWGSEILIVDLT